MSGQHTKLNEISTFRRSLDPWARPALDVLLVIEERAVLGGVLRSYDEGDMRELVNDILVRIDPYKAPEQREPNAARITRFMYEICGR